jgi:hypothetical protein
LPFELLLRLEPFPPLEPLPLFAVLLDCLPLDELEVLPVDR